MRVAVIGSGPGGTAAAWALTRAGLRVDMLDGGHEPGGDSAILAKRIREEVEAGGEPDEAIRAELKYGPGGSSGGLARGLAAVFGRGVEAERIEKRILGSTFAFEGVEEGIPLDSSTIPRSLSRGGLSNVWGAACYSWRAEDHAHWPLGPEALEPHYVTVSGILGLAQERDDLARAYPVFGEVAETVRRNPGSAADRLLDHWAERRGELAAAGFASGHARVAARLPGQHGDSCRRCGLCVYGCAWDSIYSTRRTLPELERRGLRYRGGLTVHGFEEGDSGVRVRWHDRSGGTGEDHYDALFLAAGTLSSLRIAADSLGEHDRETPILDNDMVLLPLLSTRGIVGGGFRSRFTLAEAVLAVDPGRVSERALHLQVYSFHEYFLAELATVLASLPRPLRNLPWWLLNNLLVSFTYLAGSESRIARGRVRRGDPIGRIEVEERLHPEHAAIRRRLSRMLWRSRSDLGFVALSPLAKLAPLGFSGHLAGSLPMRERPGPLEVHPDGRLAGTGGVYVVDSSVLPDLPAQNLTYTIMANSVRVAEEFAAKLK